MVSPKKQHRYLWLASGTLAGLGIWRGWQFLQRVLAQPKYLYQPPALLVEADTETHAQALAIATQNVRQAIEKRPLLNGQVKTVLCAGIRNFREPWARDFGFASFGLLEMGEETAVRECLEVFLTYQKSDGQFPVKVHSTNVLERYFHSFFNRHQPTHSPIRPKYITAHNTISLDGNSLLIIAACHYAQRTGNDHFLHTHWHAFLRALTWLETHARPDDGLLRQGPYADWADSVARAGRVLYTNVLYWKALQDMAQAATRLGLVSDAERLADEAKWIEEAIQNYFWRDDLGYFITSRRFQFLSSSGNLLAVAWGLATPEQAHRILDNMSRFGMADPVPTKVTHQPYPDRYIAIENRFAGIGHYHTEAAWLWLGAWHVIALARMGRQAEAETLFDRICRTIAADGVVHEVYGTDGRFLSTRWYTSEAPLTWNASMVIYAWHVLQRHRPK
ncbi:MAG: hypothetical protein D6706_10960 [Chloroflexi bacterium]|nr:MAG: hypothetical protein D6706_10960 [Chloroflexota bacterium]